MREAKKIAMMVGLVGAVASAYAQKAETQLLGVKLFDPSLRVINLYGTPDSIEAVNIGGGGNAGPGGAGGPSFGGGGRPGGAPAFGPRGGGGGGRLGGGAGGGASADQRLPSPFDFGNTILQGGPPTPAGGSSSFGPAGGSGGPPGGFPGGPPGGVPGAPRGGGAPAPAGAGERVTYTRWVYNRAGSKYGFVIDKQSRVVQIEAIGLQNQRVKTRQGVGFGSTFATIIRKYGAPDGYEIAGDNVTVKYLTRRKVAFRLARLGEKKPQVVTGIVVAAAKS